MALMLAIAAPFVGQHEGLRTSPYLDVVGVRTVCYGETRIAMRQYTARQCAEFLAKALETDFAPAVAQASPGIMSASRPIASQA